MRRWNGRGALAIAGRSGRTRKSFASFRQTRLASSNAKSPKAYISIDERDGPDFQQHQHRYQHQHQYAVFQKTPIPERKPIEVWAALLEGALPPHLRDQNVSPPLLTISATDLAEILLAAQYTKTSDRCGHDLLYYLGFTQGRWSAVVWLIKKLVDRFPIPPHADVDTLNYLALWEQAPPFRTPLSTKSLIKDDGPPRDLTANAEHVASNVEERPLNLRMDTVLNGSHLIKARSLDEMTGPRRDDLAHDALGQIWRTLGAMTQVCAGGDIRPEVLEIIAYLHHREIMPTSIYQYQPRMDKSAIQQPPLLPLLSSRILASLSDAAWRAHEKLMVEEARARQGDGALNRSNVLAAPYRARVDGLFPEVWLELILWSCLHGGWLEQGGFILKSVVQQKDWKPLSWREYEKALSPTGRLDNNDWDAWDYLFKTRGAKSMDPPSDPIPEVRRTISAEVVNAYIDAIAGMPSVKLVPGGFYPVLRLLEFKEFLAKQNLGLTTGSWDALAIRVMDSQAESRVKDTGLLAKIVELSPGLDQGLSSKNMQDLPAYVLDGGLAMQGILNRVLHGRLLNGNLEAALRAFQDMLARTDRDKQTSLASFMEGSNPLLRALHQDEMFTSNVTGIDYPAFNLQIPTTTLAMLLDLVTQSKKYQFGRWLLYSKDADGPVIGKDLYNDPFLIPALVRFAAATQDSSLFSTLRELPNFSIYLVLDAQIDAMRWDAATGIVEHTFEDTTFGKRVLRWTWKMDNLANLARVMLSQVPDAAAGEAASRESLQSAMKLFTTMVNKVSRGSFLAVGASVQTLLTALASVDETWAKFCFDLQRLKGHHDFEMTSLQFNHLLGGVVTAYGSSAGIRLLDLFWPRSVRRSHRASSSPAPYRRDASVRPRIVVPLPGMSHEHKAVVYGGVKPNVQTITIILQKALEELGNPTNDVAKTSPTGTGTQADKIEAETGDGKGEMTPRGMVAWAARQMADLSDVTGRSDVVFNLGRFLDSLGMEELRGALPDIVESVGMHLSRDSVEDDGSHDVASEAEERIDGVEAAAK
ncbi:uncharacterized protein RCC_01566 [Ramularia collo-cygni]|uniref:Uncharacterized protein n=1 Tax=Ramularia collo-cygni TaxID=112498 RepID=A0A2D3ULY4_9PEZI|nr:uncharacterized protein RCC_01566 [Ramularia collo-cygni]CZT15732.1 uncharacterized protein RCC_01566 [Ramularia collo-cygni]